MRFTERELLDIRLSCAIIYIINKMNEAGMIERELINLNNQIVAAGLLPELNQQRLLNN